MTNELWLHEKPVDRMMKSSLTVYKPLDCMTSFGISSLEGMRPVGRLEDRPSWRMFCPARVIGDQLGFERFERTRGGKNVECRKEKMGKKEGWD